MRALRLVAPLLLLVVTACATGAAHPAAPSGPPAATGANAAPQAAIIDTSATAVANYRAWLDYEMNSDVDRLRDFETDAYPAGISVCAQLALNPDTGAVERTLTEARGWTGTGAAAIIKGAVNALCPQFDRGYQTYFDRTVAAASVALAGALPWSNGPPPDIEIGYFMKAACGYLATTGSANGLEAHLHSFRSGAANGAAPAAAFVQRVPDDQLLRRATHHAVFAGCLADHLELNAYWTTA